MNQAAITVWGVVSLRALRVHWALAELGLDYRTEPIQSRTGETLTAHYTGLNPKQKIPFLVDGEIGISESAAIVQHLFRVHGPGTPVYLPATAGAQAASDEWCYFAMTELDAHSLYLIRRHGYLPEIYGAAPEAVASAKEYFRKQMAAVGARVAGANPYLFGARIGAADILLTTCLDWAVGYEIPLDRPVLDYLGRTTSRPAYLAAVARHALPAP